MGWLSSHPLADGKTMVTGCQKVQKEGSTPAWLHEGIMHIQVILHEVFMHVASSLTGPRRIAPPPAPTAALATIGGHTCPDAAWHSQDTSQLFGNPSHLNEEH